jgi:hypothetical protein
MKLKTTTQDQAVLENPDQAPEVLATRRAVEAAERERDEAERHLRQLPYHEGTADVSWPAIQAREAVRVAQEKLERARVEFRGARDRAWAPRRKQQLEAYRRELQALDREFLAPTFERAQHVFEMRDAALAEGHELPLTGLERIFCQSDGFKPLYRFLKEEKWLADGLM